MWGVNVGLILDGERMMLLCWGLSSSPAGCITLHHLDKKVNKSYFVMTSRSN